MRFFFSFLTLSILAAVAATYSDSTQFPAEGCPPGWIESSEGCFLLYSAKVLTWADSQLECEKLGGFLAEPRGEEQVALLTSLAFVEESVLGVQSWWLGLSDRGQEGRWIWQHSVEDVSYTNWAPGAPSGSEINKDCAIMISEEQFKWSDENCLQARAAPICQRGSGVATTAEPDTTTTEATTHSQYVLLLVGGFGNTGYLSSMEVYGSNCQVPDLPTPTYGLIVENYDNKILACGGRTSLGDPPLCYSLQTSGWVEHSNMGIGRYRASAIITNSNALYVLGGQDFTATYSSVYLTPGSNNWLAGPAIPGDGVYRSCAIGLGDGFLVIGGRYGDQTQVLEYDGSAWNNWPRLTVGRWAHSCVEDGSQIIVAGGYVSGSVSATTLIINTLTKTYTDGPDMAVARSYFAFNRVNGQKLAVGGWDGTDQLASGETFDVSSGGEVLATVMTVGREDHEATVVPKSVLASMFGCS